MTALRLESLFDGIGVFPLAAVRCGIEPVWASEIENAPISITKRHFPDMVHLGDVTKLDGRDLPPVHIITFGSPCQNLSQIGNRKGLAGEKSSLFFQAIRIIREMRDFHVRKHFFRRRLLRRGSSDTPRPLSACSSYFLCQDSQRCKISSYILSYLSSVSCALSTIPEAPIASFVKVLPSVQFLK